jgi:hypothetical protein
MDEVNLMIRCQYQVLALRISVISVKIQLYLPKIFFFSITFLPLFAPGHTLISYYHEPRPPPCLINDLPIFCTYMAFIHQL